VADSDCLLGEDRTDSWCQRMLEVLEVSLDHSTARDLPGHTNCAPAGNRPVPKPAIRHFDRRPWSSLTLDATKDNPLTEFLSGVKLKDCWHGKIASTMKGRKHVGIVQTVAAHCYGPNGLRYFAAVAHDPSASGAVENEMRKLTQYDTLTGLPNRVRMSVVVEESIRHVPTGMRALAVVKLHQIGFVDETPGRNSREQILQKVSMLLSALLGPRDVVGRISDDEFMIMLHAVTNGEEAGVLLTSILNEIAALRSGHGQQEQWHASEGHALFPDNGNRFQSLCDHAYAKLHEGGPQNPEQSSPRSSDLARTVRPINLEGAPIQVRRTSPAVRCSTWKPIKSG
jgi:diguanylate cyclase (GGDEF)-like protein